MREACGVDGCGGEHLALGLCQAHYYKRRRHLAGACSFVGCTNVAGARGLCGRHYRISLLEQPARVTRVTCEVDGCGKPHHANGLCGMHGARVRAGIGLTAKTRRSCYKRQAGSVCSVDGCGRAQRSGDMCNAHRLRVRAHGDVGAGEPILVRTGRTIMNGYYRVHRPGHPNSDANGNIFEHRLVMSESLGRPLGANENVHHKNGDRLDNRLVAGHEMKCQATCCNLELWSKSQMPGQRVADQIDWATAVLRRYAPERLIRGSKGGGDTTL